MNSTDTLTTKQAGERMHCSAQEVCRKVRLKQIPPEYVIRGKRKILIKAAYFEVGMPANVVPFGRHMDEEVLGQSIARHLAADPAFACSMVSALLDAAMHNTNRRVG